jgi:hypothetical protein
MPRIIQITAAKHCFFALDEEGSVWCADYDELENAIDGGLLRKSALGEISAEEVSGIWQRCPSLPSSEEAT